MFTFHIVRNKRHKILIKIQLSLPFIVFVFVSVPVAWVISEDLIKTKSFVNVVGICYQFEDLSNVMKSVGTDDDAKVFSTTINCQPLLQ